jgi:colicin import membrane protein
MLIGLWWTSETRPVSVPGPVIEVDLIGPTAAPKSVAVSSPKLTTPKPALPKPEPPKPPKPEPPKPPEIEAPPPTVVHEDTKEQERITALAAEKAEQEKREQEEKVRQRQVELEEEKQRKLREEQQKQLAQIRKEREAVEKKLKLERERLAQIEDRNQKQAQAQAQPETEHEAEQAQTGAGGRDDDLTARYAAAIQAAVTNNWNRPDNAQAGLRCVLNIAQIPGGDVISVSIGTPCNADPVTRTSIEQAVMKAAPLPYQGYEKVFQRNIKFNFRYDG